MTFLDTSDLQNERVFLKLTGTADARPDLGLLDTYYFDIRVPSGVRVGTCDLRIGERARTRIRGNVGYTIFPPYRGNHYASSALALLMSLAQKHGMTVLRVCMNAENTASARTCERLGGIPVEYLHVPEEKNDIVRRVKAYELVL